MLFFFLEKKKIEILKKSNSKKFAMMKQGHDQGKLQNYTL